MSIKRKINPLIAITGLDNAGKTTFIHRLKTGEFKPDFHPTIGYDLSFLERDDFRFDIVDLGGHEAFRTTFWENFVTSCHGCIFIFDRSDAKRINLAKEWLWKVEKWVPKDANFAFFANKSDILPSMSLDDIIEGLELSKFSESPLKSFRIFETSSKTGENIEDCWNWLAKSIRNRIDSKKFVHVHGFEIYDDRIESIIRENLASEENEKDIEKIMGIFRTHSLKMIDSLPHINIEGYTAHILKKGDYRAVIYVDKDDPHSLAREIGLSLFFNSLSRINHDLKVDKEFLLNQVKDIVWET